MFRCRSAADQSEIRDVMIGGGAVVGMLWMIGILFALGYVLLVGFLVFQGERLLASVDTGQAIRWTAGLMATAALLGWWIAGAWLSLWAIADWQPRPVFVVVAFLLWLAGVPVAAALPVRLRYRVPLVRRSDAGWLKTTLGTVVVVSASLFLWDYLAYREEGLVDVIALDAFQRVGYDEERVQLGDFATSEGGGPSMCLRGTGNDWVRKRGTAGDAALETLEALAVSYENDGWMVSRFWAGPDVQSVIAVNPDRATQIVARFEEPRLGMRITKAKERCQVDGPDGLRPEESGVLGIPVESFELDE